MKTFWIARAIVGTADCPFRDKHPGGQDELKVLLPRQQREMIALPGYDSMLPPPFRIPRIQHGPTCALISVDDSIVAGETDTTVTFNVRGGGTATVNKAVPTAADLAAAGIN
jgi:hypothetical protein